MKVELVLKKLDIILRERDLNIRIYIIFMFFVFVHYLYYFPSEETLCDNNNNIQMSVHGSKGHFYCLFTYSSIRYTMSRETQYKVIIMAFSSWFPEINNACNSTALDELPISISRAAQGHLLAPTAGFKCWLKYVVLQHTDVQTSLTQGNSDIDC